MILRGITELQSQVFKAYADKFGEALGTAEISVEVSIGEVIWRMQEAIAANMPISDVDPLYADIPEGDDI